jgi:hypothetical protein
LAERGMSDASYRSAKSGLSLKTAERGMSDASYRSTMSDFSLESTKDNMSDASYRSAKSGLSFKTAEEEGPLSFKSATSEIHSKKSKHNHHPFSPPICHRCGNPLSKSHLKTTFQEDGEWKEIGFCSYHCFDREKKIFE